MSLPILVLASVVWCLVAGLFLVIGIGHDPSEPVARFVVAAWIVSVVPIVLHIDDDRERRFRNIAVSAIPGLVLGAVFVVPEDAGFVTFVVVWAVVEISSSLASAVTIVRHGVLLSRLFPDMGSIDVLRVAVVTADAERRIFPHSLLSCVIPLFDENGRPVAVFRSVPGRKSVVPLRRRIPASLVGPGRTCRWRTVGRGLVLCDGGPERSVIVENGRGPVSFFELDTGSPHLFVGDTDPDMSAVVDAFGRLPSRAREDSSVEPVVHTNGPVPRPLAAVLGGVRVSPAPDTIATTVSRFLAGATDPAVPAFSPTMTVRSVAATVPAAIHVGHVALSMVALRIVVSVALRRLVMPRSYE